MYVHVKKNINFTCSKTHIQHFEFVQLTYSYYIVAEECIEGGETSVYE